MELNSYLNWAIGAALIAYIFYKMSRQRQPASDYEREMHDILTSDKYKVKGRNG